MTQVTLDIPSEVLVQCEHQMEKTEFKTVDEYVSFILAQVVESDDEISYSNSDCITERTIEQLKSLGYK